MAADLLPEARAVAHHLLGQVSLLKPVLAVHGTQRLLTSGNQVLVITLTWIKAQHEQGSNRSATEVV